MEKASEELTTLLKNRTVIGTSDARGEKTLLFMDGSRLILKTVPSTSNSASTSATIVKAWLTEEPAELKLDLDGGAHFLFHLAEARSSVTLRDREGKLEYGNG